MKVDRVRYGKKMTTLPYQSLYLEEEASVDPTETSFEAEKALKAKVDKRLEEWVTEEKAKATKEGRGI